MASSKQSDLQSTLPSWDLPTREGPLVFYLSVANHPEPAVIGTRKGLPSGTSVFIGRTSPSMGAGVFNFSSISRRHARITAERNGLVVEDLGSHNGTWVNGTSCVRSRLTPGDVIGVGPVLLVVHRAPLDYPLPKHPTLLGVSYALASVLADIDKVAPYPKTNVLLRGETGTGKRLVAHAIHTASARPGKLQSVNCAAPTGALLQTEIFGYERSHGDAKSERPGLIESAASGTLFLDAIGDAPMDLQVSLFRFLETGETVRLGSDVPRAIDARIVAASNLDLEELMRARRFREDLFGRLAEWVIHVPALRERVEDIPLIAAHFVRSFAGRNIPIHGRLMTALLLYAWPQNVRELKSVIERAVIESGGRAPIPLSLYLERTLVQHRPRPAGAPATLDDRARPFGKPSREQLIEILKKFKGNVRRVARDLGVSRNTIYRWCEEYGIDPDQFRADDP